MLRNPQLRMDYNKYQAGWIQVALSQAAWSYQDE
jgi:hypothetical protein